jgi:nitrile hydratase subunit beta
VSLAPGQTVRVSTRPHDGHHRTPGYLKGKQGTVARAHGRFANPETRAYGSDGNPEQRLYLVSFELDDVWPGSHSRSGDRVLADVYEHWLEAVE